ncbi:13941_t:CDS:2 [Funneliformis mosseae]|uniref:13941_t:CDS:1 n=1 Tax=Funneliformis mosseae TaxID=27381 RepID=A0A9N8VPH5_FUNMO|nr:13941_t:CDS:2 [Funneliformis mosseae]
MAEMAETILALYKIIPEYVLGSLPVIAIMGDSPYRVLDALLMDSFTPSTLEIIPAIWRRGFYGILIVKDPSDVFDKIQIIVDNDPKDKLKFHKCVTITIINSLSLDDSTYRLLYTPGESDLIMSGKGWLHVWFFTCSFIVAYLLLFLGIFTGYNTLGLIYSGMLVICRA